MLKSSPNLTDFASRISAVSCVCVLVTNESGKLNSFISSNCTSRSSFLCKKTSIVCSTSCRQYLMVSSISLLVNFLSISKGIDVSLMLLPMNPSSDLSPPSLRCITSKLYIWNFLNNELNCHPFLSSLMMKSLTSLGLNPQRIAFRIYWS